ISFWQQEVEYYVIDSPSATPLSYAERAHIANDTLKVHNNIYGNQVHLMNMIKVETEQQLLDFYQANSCKVLLLQEQEGSDVKLYCLKVYFFVFLAYALRTLAGYIP